MPLIQLNPDHNDTTECFKRQSRMSFSNEFFVKPKTTPWSFKTTAWILAYLTALLLFIWFVPNQAVKATVQPAPIVQPKQQHLLPNLQTQLRAFKACAKGATPVWTDKSTIQCFKEIP